MASSSAVMLQAKQAITPLSKMVDVPESPHHPLTAMLIALPRVGIFPTQEGPPHATADHVVVGRILQADLT
ncbi:hypothetical protein WL1483_2394 [Aeromonas schubertii]|uniref:Uncharacterized protein n=1 Tax=Aeromonas schubertii TaxID=652 RepID=A0A0S2SJE2_9GAMM|nr:hypothetical protein WL1483_2394 [Aeromonas schubertii]